MIIGQFIFSLPIIVNLTVVALQQLNPKLRLQITALGASRWQALWLLGREVRLPLLVAYMAGFGAVVSEVGASQMLGGNLPGSTRVLTCQYRKPKLGRSGDGVHQGWRVN